MSRQRIGTYPSAATRADSSPYVPPVGGTPAWLSGVAVDAWKEIPNSSLSLLTTGMTGTTPATSLAGRMNAWNGYALAGSTVWSVRQGGHSDYFGNEVNKFDLSLDAPAWTQVKASTPFSGGLIVDGAGYYSDGTPAAVHGYQNQHHIAARGWIASVGSTAVPLNGGSNSECVVYDIASNSYLAANTMPDCATLAAAEWACWKDPVTDNLYFCMGYAVYKWTQASNTWSSGAIATFSDFYGIASVAAVDTTRRRAILIAGDPGARVPKVWDLSNDTYASFTPTGDLTVINRQGACGLTYCPTTDRFYAMTGDATNGGELYEIHPTTWAITAKTTTGATGMPVGNGAVDVHGIAGRFFYVPSVGGIVYFPQHSANAWFLRLH